MYVVCSDDKVSEVVGQIAVLQKRRKQKRPTTMTVFLQQRVIFSLLAAAAAAADDPGPEFLYGVYIQYMYSSKSTYRYYIVLQSSPPADDRYLP